MLVVTKRVLKPSEYHALEFWIMISEICVCHFIILSFLFEAKCEINEFNKLGQSCDCGFIKISLNRVEVSLSKPPIAFLKLTN